MSEGSQGSHAGDGGGSMNLMEARSLINVWVRVEQARYADTKWKERDKDATRLMTEGLRPGTWWRDFIDQYIHRAAILGVNTPLGQQALMKALVTLHAACTAMVVATDGVLLPPAGLPSGAQEAGE